MTTKRYVLSLFVVFFVATTLYAQEPRNKKDSNMPSFTWGARIGFAATGTYLTEAIIDGHEITEYTQDTQVGNFVALQIRWSSTRFLIQSGLGLSFNKSSFLTDKNSWNPESPKDELSCTYKMVSIMVPLQFGYHIVNQAPYCMSVFTGPRLRYIPDKYFTSTINNTNPYSFTERPNGFCIGWTAGLSVQIGRTFLDFEYETTINNLSGSLNENKGAIPATTYKLDRRMGIISFSYGIMF